MRQSFFGNWGWNGCIAWLHSRPAGGGCCACRNLCWLFSGQGDIKLFLEKLCSAKALAQRSCIRAGCKGIFVFFSKKNATSEKGFLGISTGQNFSRLKNDGEVSEEWILWCGKIARIWDGNPYFPQYLIKSRVSFNKKQTLFLCKNQGKRDFYCFFALSSFFFWHFVIK